MLKQNETRYMEQQHLQRVGGMATMPTRAHTFRIALENILPQVDKLYLYLDKQNEVPEAITRHPKIVPLLPAKFGNIRGAGKLLGVELHAEPCLYFCFDDDILYPPNYVELLARALRRHYFRAIVGLHGTVFRPPHLSYCRNRFLIHFSVGLEFDVHVDELGTGTMAFHSRSVHFHPKKWRHHDMADLMVAIESVQQEVPRIVVRRPHNFLRPLEEHQEDSLYKRLLHDDARETAIMHAALAAYPANWQNCTSMTNKDCTRQSLGFSE